jgi:hypothetical protein
VQMAKNDPEAPRKSSLSDCTWLENEHGSSNLETLKFLMHFRESGNSLYFIFTHTHIFSSLSFFSFSHTHIFLSFFLFLIFFFFFLIIFLFAPL